MEEESSKKIELLNGDCLDMMKGIPDNSVDAIVTDPPYGINFMNKKWDSPGGMVGQMATGDEKRGGFAYGGSHSRGYKDCDSFKFQGHMTPMFKEMLRVAKPGAHLLAFGGTRMYHRLACAIEDAGWEIRDCLGWLYSSGFPKSMDISKAIDKKLGAERKVIGKNTSRHGGGNGTLFGGGIGPETGYITEPSSDEAKKWSGWGTCLKPAFEPIVLARKPIEGTVADNVLKYGVGGINIDECRVPFESEEDKASAKPQGKATSKVGALAGGVENDRERTEFTPKDVDGRFPANIIHDGSDGVLEVFPDNVKGGTWNTTKGARHFNNNGAKTDFENHGADASTGSAARFFYCAKASKKEKGKDNPHPTVKPIKLMEYLVKLITPQGGIVLDPFMGSGSTGIAAIQLGDGFIGIEKEPEYFNIAENRIKNA